MAWRLLPLLGELGHDLLDPVDGLEDRGDRGRGDARAVAELADDGFGRMRQRFEPRQPDEATGAFDRVNEPEDVAQDIPVIGFLLEADELPIDHIEMLAGLAEKLLQQLVHARTAHLHHGFGPDSAVQGFMIS